MRATVSDRRAATTPPTIIDVRNGLRRSLGPAFEDVWETVCLSCDIPHSRPPRHQAEEGDVDAHGATDAGQDVISDVVLSEAVIDLDRVLDVVADQDALCRVLAMSWRIRRTAAVKLKEIGR